MKKRMLMGMLCLALSAGITGCGGETPEQPEENKNTENKTEQEKAPVAETEALLGDWLFESGKTGENAELFFPDTERVQFFKNDFRESYEGTWKRTGDESISLELFPAEGGGAPIKGDYAFRLTTEGVTALELTAETGSSPLTEEHGETAVSFRNRALDDVYSAAWNYCETVNDHRPQFCVIDSVDADGMMVHLYDDMGDHTATCAWYVIDPVTFEGYDGVTFEPIRFYEFIDGVG